MRARSSLESKRGSSQCSQPRGIRLIVAYKLTKGLLTFVVGVMLLAVVAIGHTPAVIDETVHLTAAWSTRLATAIAGVATPHHVAFACIALCLDGAFTLFEGWALHAGKCWAPWLIVLATVSFVPFEIVAIAHHRRIGRVVLLALNLAIVAYLARRARAEGPPPWRRDGLDE